MEKEDRNKIVLNFSAKYLIKKEKRISKSGKTYEIFWILIPDDENLNKSEKKVFYLPSWLIFPDKDKERRYSRLERGRVYSVYDAIAKNDDYEINRDHYQLISADDLVDIFEKNDPNDYRSWKLQENLRRNDPDKEN